MPSDADLPLLLPDHVVFTCQQSGACCREFPYHFVQTPDGVAVGVSFACTAVRAHQGATLPARRDDVRAVLAGSTRVERLPERLTLFGAVDLDWSAYQPIEAALLDLLTNVERPLPVGLLAGSALLSLCVGLTQIEARARRAGQAPPATLEQGLAELRVSRYRRLLDIAATARYPRRPSLTYLAPPYTWLQLTRRRLSRPALLLSVYGNYFRFRRARGRLPDAIGGGPPFELESVLGVRFDGGAAGVEPFLREYWSHVVFRKTLTPMHGIFRGYQTLLALYSFTKLAARLHAWRAGRPATALADVEEAVGLIERAFVLHARYTDLFRLTPIVTVLADRLYQQPSFVRTAALEPEG